MPATPPGPPPGRPADHSPSPTLRRPRAPGARGPGESEELSA